MSSWTVHTLPNCVKNSMPSLGVPNTSWTLLVILSCSLQKKNARYDSESVKESLIRRGFIGEEELNARLATYKSFQKNDMKMADNSRALFDWTAKQTYIALGNMMTTASMIGIDSCPIEGFNYDKVNTILAQEGIIDPDKEGIASMVSFGYRLRDPKHPRSRKPREEVITWWD